MLGGGPLNEKVGFKIPTRAIAIIIFCAVRYTVVLQSWTFGVGWSSGPLGVARGIKGSGTGLTFDPLRLLSYLIKYPSRTNTQPEHLNHIYTL